MGLWNSATSQIFGPQIASRLASAASAILRANLRTAQQDGGYRLKIHPLETSAGLTEANLTFGFEVGEIERYGGGTALADNSAAFSTAASVFTGSATPGRLRLGPGTYRFTAGITLNASYCALIGEQSVLEFSSVSAGDAVLVTGTVNPPYGQSRAIIEGVTITGNGSGGAVNGLHFYSAGSGAGPSRITLRNCAVTAFGTGELFDSNAYLISHFDCEIYGNGNNVVTVGAPTNAGENINYHGGAIFNSPGYGVWIKGGTYDLHFYGTSIDGCGSPSAGGLIRVENGELHFNGHLESISGETAIYVPSTASTCFITFNGYIAQDVAGGTAPLIDVQGPGYVTLLGGRIVAVSGTDTIVSMTAGRFANWGCEYQFGAGTTSESFAAGVNFVSVVPNFQEFSLNYNVSASSVSVSSGVVDGSANTVALAALSTLYPISGGTPGGMLVFRDNTSGGAALFVGDSTAGMTALHNGITGFNCLYSGGQLQVEVTSGTVPRTIAWAILQSNKS